MRSERRKRKEKEKRKRENKKRKESKKEKTKDKRKTKNKKNNSKPSIISAKLSSLVKANPKKHFSNLVIESVVMCFAVSSHWYDIL